MTQSADWFGEKYRDIWALLAVVASVLAAGPGSARAGAEPSFYDQEVARFTRLAASGKPALEVEAAQGFYNLRSQAGEKHCCRWRNRRTSKSAWRRCGPWAPAGGVTLSAS